jgi:CubicO group peptidase (beta-lactamase class C family)
MKISGALLAMSLSSQAAFAQSGDAGVTNLLEPIRVSHKLPALGAALVTSKGLVVSGVTGVRKRDTKVAATVDDLWHLGSDTKAMTATVIASLVERKLLSWESTVGSVFPDLAEKMPPDFRAITLTQLLAHRAGVPANVDWGFVARDDKPLREQRMMALQIAAATKLSSVPGTKYDYSNLGYVLAATMAERVSDTPWESLIQTAVFKPLGMSSCGFGGLGTAGRIDQPWPHTENGAPAATNGPLVDNREVMGPAGTVHCSIADWSKFIVDQLVGESGGGRLLTIPSYKFLHTPKFGGEYAAGWGVASRPWAGGTVLTHAGSNTMNYCVVWIAPAKDFAVLAVTNQGGPDAAAGTDEAVAALIQLQTRR